MLTKTKFAIATVLVLTSASAGFAANAGRAAPGWSQGNPGLTPGSKAEQDWFERASRPSNL
ncbi:MAG: hypothetical protein JO328_15865 [Hyphomicrobiales bacterium]|nr:hypothetical protein [Hyphomicrobiales bacterium]MBV8824236.1 hypothetical protein [Hyphomicrobiales bacterium]MBV9428608.1 hypothetical protein [Bradyrhizobiaceae bacterium]